MSSSTLEGAFDGRLLTDPADMAPFLEDWRKLWRGRALAVAQPNDAEGVAAVVRWCAESGTPIVPQGGNTGMSGGATPDDSGRAILLSLARLNRVRAIDPTNDTITVDAGCVLAQVQMAADEANRFFPLSLAAEGSCTIGGNLATNAGGTGVLRYGNARDLCLGLEVVTAQGEIWDGLTALRKNNSGYDLRDLFIGSEGTLGIITGAVLKLFPKPAARVAAFVGVDSVADALTIFERARETAHASLTAFEFLSSACLDLVVRHIPGARSPLDGAAKWYILIEYCGSSSEDALRDSLESLLMAALDAGHAVDAAIAQSLAQSRDFWALRENIAEAQGAEGKTIKHDIAVPISAVAGFLRECDAAVAARWPEVRFVTFGHLGDGNIHYNFSPPEGGDPAEFMSWQDDMNQLVHDLVVAHGGTISAEHGLGMLRHLEADRYRSPVDRRLQQAVKSALDPAGLLNPGKLLA
jgi:FAD/FMN-containing dehydrogenase